MVKKVVVSCLALCAALCLGSCGNGGILSQAEPSSTASAVSSASENSSAQSSSNQSPQQSSSVSQVSGELTGEDALDLAIAHAKVDPSAVKKTKIEREMKQGVPVYEIGFDMDYGEYDYKITAADGTVLDVDYEAYDYVVRQSPSNPVTMEGAKGLAASKVPGVSAGDIRIWEERDDGLLSFEGEFYFDNAKHEFEIDSSTGKILKWDADFPR